MNKIKLFYVYSFDLNDDETEEDYADFSCDVIECNPSYLYLNWGRAITCSALEGAIYILEFSLTEEELEEVIQDDHEVRAFDNSCLVNVWRWQENDEWNVIK